MKTVLGISLVLVAALAVGGCSKDHGDVMDDMTSEVNSLADVLSKIKDGPTAKAAASDLEDILESMEELKKTADGMEEPTEEEAKKLMEKLGPIMEASQKAASEMARVMAIPEAQAALKDVLEKINKTMD